MTEPEQISQTKCSTLSSKMRSGKTRLMRSKHRVFSATPALKCPINASQLHIDRLLSSSCQRHRKINWHACITTAPPEKCLTEIPTAKPYSCLEQHSAPGFRT